MIAGAMFIALQTWLSNGVRDHAELERLIDLSLQAVTDGVGDNLGA